MRTVRSFARRPRTRLRKQLVVNSAKNRDQVRTVRERHAPMPPRSKLRRRRMRMQLGRLLRQQVPGNARVREAAVAADVRETD